MLSGWGPAVSETTWTPELGSAPLGGGVAGVAGDAVAMRAPVSGTEGHIQIVIVGNRQGEFLKRQLEAALGLNSPLKISRIASVYLISPAPKSADVTLCSRFGLWERSVSLCSQKW